ncbi:MAG: UbiA family prenyltransferase [Candidatus Thermoplasmatota archaeon]
MRKIKAVWELMRLEHGFMIALAVLIGSVISIKSLPSVDVFIFTFLTALLLEASTFALNDYYDLEIDKLNNRVDRPLVRGDIRPETALYIFYVLFPLGILSSYLVNLTCFMMALVTGLFAIIYDIFFKRVKVIGNIFIAYTMAIPFIFGAVSVTSDDFLSLGMQSAVFILALIAFFAGAGREIMKDVMDYAGDKAKGVRSLPRYIGVYASNIVSVFFYLVAILLSFLPYFLPRYDSYYNNSYYLMFILVTDVLLLRTSLHLTFKKKPDFIFHRRLTLFALFIGLIGFLVGALTG